MSLEQVVMAFVLVIFIMASYNARSKANKIYVHYTAVDNTVKEKWVSINDKTVVFDKKKFDILPERIKSRWLCKGFNMFFPTRVNYIEFSWYSRWPHDPRRYNLTLVDPTLRKLIDKNETMQSFVKSSNPSVKTTQGKLAAWLPFISIVAVLLVAVYFINEIEGIKQFIAQLQNSINAINQR